MLPENDFCVLYFKTYFNIHSKDIKSDVHKNLSEWDENPLMSCICKEK